MSNSNTALFTPINIGPITLKHRIVFAALTRGRNDENHVATDVQAEYYGQRATDGGLLIVEAMNVNKQAGMSPGTPGIFSKEHVEGWKKVTAAVHAKGGYIQSQLWHQGRAASSKYIKETPLAPSPIAIKGMEFMGDYVYETPREITKEEMKQYVKDFQLAAKNSLEAGFDGVQFHAANGFFFDQFFNSASNQRSDEYGGSPENRSRFFFQILDGLIEAVGIELVSVRLSPWAAFLDVEDEDSYATWGYVVKRLQAEYPKLAFLDMVEPRSVLYDDSYNFEQKESLDPFRAVWKGPIVTTGGYTYDPKRAFEIAKKNPNNLTGFGRLFIANPDLVERLRNNWPFNKYDRSTFYTGGAKGYVDYPFYKAE
ncbi:NADH:flavin oxidoreductase [Penicillium brasilianum]|uniref:NADH:flavin oxidoreductase n=1 Tax=Penicillium brasilianum TaxID=104259 RepID=A0A1S9RP44_PENBI|nr:NADH:flavin oxidoreductase [Penicillium brasilianum]